MSTKVTSKEELSAMINSNETVIWEGTPKRTAFYINRFIGEGALPLTWMIISFMILNIYLGFNIPIFSLGQILLAFIIWNIPVWLWLIKAGCTGLALKGTYYIITDEAIYFKNGANEFEVFKTEDTRVEFKDIQELRHHTGLLDRVCGVSDAYMKVNINNKTKKMYFIDIIDAPKAIAIIKQRINKVKENILSNTPEVEGV